MLDKNRLKKMQDVLNDMVDSSYAAGASCVLLQNGEELCYYEAGYRDIENQVPLTRDTIFKLYSMTKPVTSVAVMRLLEEGKIDLLDPVYMYLDGFKDQKYLDGDELKDVIEPVNIKQLLDMTSGVSYPGEFNASDRAVGKVVWEAERRFKTDKAYTTVELMNEVGKCPLAFKPGLIWQYGFSADVLGAIVEVVSGQKLSDYMKANIFEPLEMTDTDFYVPEDKQSRLSKVYEDSENGLLEYTGEHLLIQNRMKDKPAFESGGAGLASTIDDYKRFNLMLMQNGEYKGRKILHPGTVRFMTKGSLTDSQAVGCRAWESLAGFTYGNLLRVMKDPGEAVSLSSKGEYGWDGWLGAYMVNVPEYDIVFLMMQQKKDTGTTRYTRMMRNIIFSSLQ